MDETHNNNNNNNYIWRLLLSNPTKCNNVAALFLKNIRMLIFPPPLSCRCCLFSSASLSNTNTTLLISFKQNRQVSIDLTSIEWPFNVCYVVRLLRDRLITNSTYNMTISALDTFQYGWMLIVQKHFSNWSFDPVFIALLYNGCIVCLLR